MKHHRLAAQGLVDLGAHHRRLAGIRLGRIRDAQREGSVQLRIRRGRSGARRLQLERLQLGRRRDRRPGHSRCCTARRLRRRARRPRRGNLANRTRRTRLRSVGRGGASAPSLVAERGNLLAQRVEILSRLSLLPFDHLIGKEGEPFDE